MNITQARRLVDEIEDLLYSGSRWDLFWRKALNEIRAGDVDGPVHEAFAKLDALGALDHELNDFIGKFIRAQVRRFYQDLYRKRRWHLINGHVYPYADVLQFIRESQSILDKLKAKLERIHEEACKAASDFSQYSSSPGYLYLIKVGNYYQIEVTQDIRERMKGIDRNSLQISRWMVGSGELRDALHKKYHSRKLHESRLFALNPDQLKEVMQEIDNGRIDNELLYNYVYFIKQGGYYKIGVTEDIERIREWNLGLLIAYCSSSNCAQIKEQLYQEYRGSLLEGPKLFVLNGRQVEEIKRKLSIKNVAV